MIPTYGKVIALQRAGRYTADLFDNKLVVQEKIDGSQVSFGLGDSGVFVNSRNSVVDPTNKQFKMVYEWARANVLSLHFGYVYRGEAVTTPKHNTLKYDRIPANGVVLFDIFDSYANRMLDPDEVAREAKKLGLEYVPVFYWSDEGNLAECDITALLDRDSMLGGCKIEGVVIKAYSQPDPLSTNADSANSFLKVKVVSDAFKEVHGKDWKGRNPNGSDLSANLVAMYGTEARAQKAVQRLRDEGKLTDSPADIGALIGEMARDIADECKDEILHELWKHYGKKVVQNATRIMPDYYKREVLGMVS